MFFFGELLRRELDSYAIGLGAASCYSADDYAFNPNLAACHPQSDFQSFAGGDHAGGLDQTASSSDISQVSPDRFFCAFDVNLYGYVALDPLITAAVGLGLWPPRKRVGLEWRRVFDRFRTLKNGGWFGRC